MWPFSRTVQLNLNPDMVRYIELSAILRAVYERCEADPYPALSHEIVEMIDQGAPWLMEEWRAER